MGEEIENGIALLEGILQNWKLETGEKKSYIFFPKCTKENEMDVILFPIFKEETKEKIVLQVWAKYNLETYSLEEYMEAKNQIIVPASRFINYKKKKFIKNVLALLNIFYIAQRFMKLPEGSIEYIANQELLEEKIDAYKNIFKNILLDDDLSYIYGVNNIAVEKRPEMAKIPTKEIIKTPKADINDNSAELQEINNELINLINENYAEEIDFDNEPNIIKFEDNTNIKPIETKKKEPNDITVKRLQEIIDRISEKSMSKEKNIIKLIENIGRLAEAVEENNSETKNKISTQIHEVLYYTLNLANLCNVDVEELIKVKIKENIQTNEEEGIK